MKFMFISRRQNNIKLKGGDVQLLDYFTEKRVKKSYQVFFLLFNENFHVQLP